MQASVTYKDTVDLNFRVAAALKKQAQVITMLSVFCVCVCVCVYESVRACPPNIACGGKDTSAIHFCFRLSKVINVGKIWAFLKVIFFTDRKEVVAMR